MSALENFDETPDELAERAEAAGQPGRSAEDLIGYPPPPQEQRTPIATDPVALTDGPDPLVWAVSAHGGAGASVLASRMGFVADAGHILPSGSFDGEGRIVICCEETIIGITAAHRMVLQHINGLGGDTRLLAVVTRPSRPGWSGKKLPTAIRNHLSLLNDPLFDCEVIRLGFDDQLAVTLPEKRASLSPPQVAEWLAADKKKKAKARKVRGSLEALGLTDAAATLMTLAAQDPSNASS